MKVGHLEILVKDPEKSKRFYQEILGFEVTNVMANGRLVWLEMSGFTILLRPGEGGTNDRPLKSSQFDLVFYDNDPVKKLAELKERGIEVRGDDSGCPTFCDPDGHWFQLVNSNGEFKPI